MFTQGKGVALKHVILVLQFGNKIWFFFFFYHFISTAFPQRGKKKRTPVRPATTFSMFLSSILSPQKRHITDKNKCNFILCIILQATHIVTREMWHNFFNIFKKKLFYSCTVVLWKAVLPCVQRPSHSESAMIRSAWGSNMAVIIIWAQV